MRRRFYKHVTGIALAATLTFSLVAPVIADDGAVPTAAQQQNIISSTVLGKVNLNQVSFFELSDVNMISTSNGKTVAFKVTVHNNGNSDIDMIDYWVNLRTKSGSKSTVYLVKDEKLSERVPAKSSRTFTYYANVSSNIQLSDLQFEMIKWDFSQSSFERSLGTISVPSSYKAETPENHKRNLNVNNTDVLTYIDRVIMNKTEKYYRPTITFEFENVGSQSFAVPAYEYKIVTANGLVYPLTAKGAENLVLNPKVSDDIQLTGSIPIEVDPDGWKLVIALPVTESKIAIPIASYALPSIIQKGGGAIGQEYTFSSSSGDYHITMNSLHRMPLENEDLLTADFTISNRGDETVTIPNFQGKFILDENVEVVGKVVRADKVIGIQPNSSISLQLYSPIPYTYEFSQVKVILEEKEEDDQIVELLEIVHDNQLSPIKNVALNQKYNLDVIGNRSNIHVREIKTFEGSTANIFSVSMLAENLEKRFTDVASLNAYFETPDGLVYPASVEIPENKTAPGGKALVNFWKELPKSIDTSTLSLVVGEAVPGEDGKPSAAYVNPVSFALPKEKMDVQSDFKEIEIYPYTLSLSKIRTQINYEGWVMLITFDYELSKDPLVQVNTKDHKVVLELTDDDHKLTFTGEYALETGENENATFKIGTHSGMFEKREPDLIYDIQTLKEYNLNIYHQIRPNHKKLIASKKIRWFTTTD